MTTPDNELIDILAQEAKQRHQPASRNLKQNAINLRPKDSSTLIILRRNGPKTEMLMGKRHASHTFMPNLYVFPGGGVDIADGRVILPKGVDSQISKTTQKQLLIQMRGRKTVSKARALVLAAIRETFEETGYIIGYPNGHIQKTKSTAWQSFFNTGYAPTCAQCKFIGRAITPPYHVRRYDTRFFALWADELPNGLQQHGLGSDELEQLIWLPIDDFGSVELPSITQAMILELKKQIKNQAFIDDAPIPFYHFRHNKMQREEILVRD
ncbi:MAG: NUDIX hydrolase [Rhizobiales bacterium]|nr:NUDIX hydrolase [Hyphomicrobiales bacterium]NRB14877.1 NUDIX hydrolase [Hyphomicrobiales bacterium]